MIQYTLNLLDKIKNDIQVIDLEVDTNFNKSIRIISLIETEFNKLNFFISKYSFVNETEEI